MRCVKVSPSDLRPDKLHYLPDQTEAVYLLLRDDIVFGLAVSFRPSIIASDLFAGLILFEKPTLAHLRFLHRTVQSYSFFAQARPQHERMLDFLGLKKVGETLWQKH